MPRLRRTCINLTSPWDALTRRQIAMVLDGTDQEIEGLLCVRLYEFELREGLLVGVDVVAVLHFVEPIGRSVLIGIGLYYHSHATRIGTRIIVNRQQRIHRPGKVMSGRWTRPVVLNAARLSATSATFRAA